ncbi:MAG: PKD domain-containing protein [Microscillaceae bacterium]|nr:PKD domain-containing protein [Microscillaceae bacterium]
MGTQNQANRPCFAASLELDNSNWFYFAINRHPNQVPPFNDNELIRVDFPNLCNASTDVASTASGNIQFLRQAAGRNYINLRTFDANGNPGRVYTDSIEVIDAVTGAFTISNFANCSDGLVQALGNLGDCFGQSIQFNNLSPGFTTGAPYFNTLLWDFGDGQTSTLQNPLHTFTAPGEYEVKLTINNAEVACSNTLTQVVKIRSAPPQANFTIRSLDCETGKVVFEDLSQVPVADADLGSILTRRTWLFGDGQTFSAGRNDIASLGLDPSFKYNNWIVRGPKTSEEINNIEVQAQNLLVFEPGQRYTVSLNINNEVCCGASVSQVISLDPTDTQTNFSFLNACAGAPTSFEDLSQLAEAVSGDIDHWEWTFFDTDGTTLLGTSTLQNPVFTFASPGTYPVRLVARGTFACPKELTQNVSVLPNAISAFAVLNEPGLSPINGFAPLTLSFNNLSQNATEYEWDFGDGQISTELAPTYTFQLPAGQDQASFEVILKAFNANGCVSLSSRQVNIVGNPNALTSPEELGVLIAPNPFEQVLRLMPASAPIPHLDVKITDMLGREIYRQGFSQFSQTQTMELGHLPAGLYLLLLDTGGKKPKPKSCAANGRHCP